MTVKGLPVSLSGQSAVKITDHKLKINFANQNLSFNILFIEVCSLGPIDGKSSLI